MSRQLPLLPPSLSEVIADVEAGYPREACGLLLSRQGDWRVRPMTNAYDRYHNLDPLRFPRTARTAYLFDPKEWLQVSREADERGEHIACVYHSHIDAGAYFSAEDRAMAAPDGDPVLPGTAYLVLAVDRGKATAAKLFWWGEQEFHEATVHLERRQE
jgi:[CysO sulfur-carrier protein]-S-L-cysteine hydrolase